MYTLFIFWQSCSLIFSIVHTYSKSGASSRIACGSIVTLDLRNPLALRPNKIKYIHIPQDVKVNGTNTQHPHFTGKWPYNLTCPFWSLVIPNFIVTLTHPDVVILKWQLFLHRQGLQSWHRAQELSNTTVNNQTSLYKGWTPQWHLTKIHY